MLTGNSDQFSVFFTPVGEDHHNMTTMMDVDKPIKKLIAPAMAMNATSKTLIEMIKMYVNGTTVDQLKTKMNISQDVIDALNTTSFKV